MGTRYLSRRLNEAVCVRLPDGRTVRVAVVARAGERYRLAITAPGDVPVHREEVYDVIYPEGDDLGVAI